MKMTGSLRISMDKALTDIHALHGSVLGREGVCYDIPDVCLFYDLKRYL